MAADALRRNCGAIYDKRLLVRGEQTRNRFVWGKRTKMHGKGRAWKMCVPEKPSAGSVFGAYACDAS